MPENDFIWTGIGSGANVDSQSSYGTNTVTGTGFTPDTVAPSSTCNKMWRQATAAMALLGTFINSEGFNALDDGNMSELLLAFTNALSAFVIANSPQKPHGYQTIGGSGNFTVPVNVYWIRVRIWGGGGSGGGAAPGSSAGGGGGGGGYAEGWIAVTPGQVIAVTVSIAAQGGYPGQDGNAGGTSSFGNYLSATGGQPGKGAAANGGGAGGAGGTGSGGQFAVGGGAGLQGSGSGSTYAAGPGGAAFGIFGATIAEAFAGPGVNASFAAGGAGGLDGGNGGLGGPGLCLVEWS